LADIVMHPQEETGTLNRNTEIKGEINCKNISFRYASNEADVLKKLNFKVGVGESVAITGHSGCGKTTLMQLLVGLYQPTSGSIEIDGEELCSVGLGNYRKQIAAVHQDDQLLSGTIADNISFFDPSPDTEHVSKCCKMAGILTDIQAMPMKFNTLIGDMGSALSGGQKQRIFLARALYKKPKIIILDEATSHLDHNAESIVNDAIKSLNITRIIIAHRKETIASADKVFEMSDGVMAEKV
jgi:ATP-binding cassette subfamily B protein RaxB